MGTVIENKIKTIYSKCKPLTNCYSKVYFDRIDEMWTLGDSFIYSYLDCSVKRLAFFAEEIDTLSNLLHLPEKGRYNLEFITNDESEYYDILENAGYHIQAKMLRISNLDCRTIVGTLDDLSKGGDKGTIASLTDVDEINQLLWRVFNTEISHLFDNETLALEINKGHTRIHRGENNEIDAILIAEVMPRKFYINQIVNLGDKHNIHCMLQEELREYLNGGGKYVYAWVDSTNVASLRFHEKYGLIHDGIFCMNYFTEK